MAANKRVTIKNIADRVGVSVATVSRVLSGQAVRYRISATTAETIKKAAKELHYSPNQVARALRLKRTNTIGLIVPDIANPFFSSIARSIEIESRKHGYSMILCDTLENTDLEIDSIALLQNRYVDGLIICPVGQNIEHLQQLYEEGTLMVTVDRHFPQLRCPKVISDNYAGAFEAVRFLINNGHHHIGCIQGLHVSSVNENRVQGYLNAHIDHNITVDKSLIVGDSFGENNGYIGAKLLINRAKRPTAIFAVSNLISLGVLRAAAEEGLSIPEDISLISFDDQPYSEFLATPMTTVEQRSTEMGSIAFKLLLDQIENKTRSNHNNVKLSTKLIVRKSVKRIETVEKVQ